MSASNRVPVRLTWPEGGDIQHWTYFELRDTYTDPLALLKFECAPEKKDRAKYRALLKKGRIVTLFINNVNQGGFLITTVTKTISPSGGVTYAFECKTPLCTPYEGSVALDLTFSAQTDAPVADVILEALAPYGFDTIEGDGAASVSAMTGKAIGKGKAAINVKALTAQELKANPGETAYAFAARIFQRLGVCLRMHPNGTLLCGAPDYDQDASYSLAQDPTGQAPGDYFFGDIEIVDTNDGQFSECRVRGHLDDKAGAKATAKPDATVTAADINPSRPAYASVGAAYKPKIIVDKDSRDVKRCESAAKFALGIRAKDAFSISGTVDGFVAKSGSIWSVNTCVDVYIAEEEIREKMWIAERLFKQDVKGAQVARLRVLPLGAVLLGSEPGSA
jgi:hypothetical protein